MAGYGKNQCTSKSKQSGNRCQKPALIGKKNCKMHGGVYAEGPLSKVWKTGKYAKSLTGKLLAHYDQGLLNPERILEMTDELSLLDMRVQQLAAEVTKDAGTTTFEEAIEGLVDLRTAIRLKYGNAIIMQRYKHVEELLQEGYNREEKWSEILKTIEHRRKISETECKRLVASQSVVPIAEVRDFFRKIAEAYKHAVVQHADSGTAAKILATASQRQPPIMAR